MEVGIGAGEPVGEKIEFDQAADMAENLTKNYLENLIDHIQTGEVYESWKEELERSNL